MLKIVRMCLLAYPRLQILLDHHFPGKDHQQRPVLDVRIRLVSERMVVHVRQRMPVAVMSLSRVVSTGLA